MTSMHVLGDDCKERVSNAYTLIIISTADHNYHTYSFQSSHQSILLRHMRRKIPTLIIEMDERSIHKGDTFQDVLQRLAKIVTVAKRHILVQHDVDLNGKFLVRGMICLYTLDLSYGVSETHRQVE